MVPAAISSRIRVSESIITAAKIQDAQACCAKRGFVVERFEPTPRHWQQQPVTPPLPYLCSVTAVPGKFNDMLMVKYTDFGIYLDGGDLGEILMPNKYVPHNTNVG